MKIKKAVITAAGERQRRLPLQSLVDRDGTSRTVLAILINEILEARIEEVCVVVWPGDEQIFMDAVPEHAGLLRFVPQTRPFGYGDALWRARAFTADEPFLHLVGDHLYLGRHGCGAKQLVSLADNEDCSVSAVRATHESSLTSFGCIGGQPTGNHAGLYRVDTVLEKPTPTIAEQHLIVPGMRAGHYLAFFGMHVLTPSVLGILGDLIQTAQTRVLLTDALRILATREKYLALQVGAERYDLGATYGLLTSQLALALAGKDRDEVLSLLLSLLANEQLRSAAAATLAAGAPQ